eukprot:scaffold24885_cov79-Phaeocystis_antarctica.AAC.2
MALLSGPEGSLEQGVGLSSGGWPRGLLRAGTLLDHAAAPPMKPRAACTWRRVACRRHRRLHTGRSARARAAAAASPRTSAGMQNPTASPARAAAASPRASRAESQRTARARGAAA